MEKKNITSLLVTGVAGGAIALGGSAIYQNMTNTSTANNNANSSVNTVNVQVNTDTTKAIKKISNTVVSVLNYQKSSSSSDLERIFGNENNNNNNDSNDPQLAGEGSGVIYKKDGNTAYVVTNYHVIEGASSLEVLMAGGQKVTAEVVGSDAYSDLAVLKIDAKYVKETATFGNSDKLTVGEPAIAVGSPLGSEYANSATEGIVSSLNRNVVLQNNQGQTINVNAIQTDAAINPGNSGGALINIQGQVIGITSSKITSTPSGTSSNGVSVEGMGFAIPANDVVNIINKLEKDGKVIRPALGVQMVNLSSLSQNMLASLNLPENVTSGVAIAEVQSGMPAAKAGLKKGDVIVKINDDEVTSSVNLQSTLYKSSIGDTIKVTYYRDGKQATANIKLDKTNSDINFDKQN
ncbi:MAG TPA: serine protease [Lactococcus sp.]|uniref:Trypsin-like peptidase domain-containing protein n=1 Tax=Lactococcus muris TaxID=2941330 RepID=A0ABV4DEW3_9LACT|nr:MULTISPECIES: trypsin-like peptidase domain-containing protein [Lactococcus]HAP15469.1 serine protease [Lactococcus sp.]HBC89978.1 serine protease [Lactococcus sp.]